MYYIMQIYDFFYKKVDFYLDYKIITFTFVVY